MTRVAFVLAQSESGWTGGYNYFLNLFSALAQLPDLRFEPMLLTASSNDRDSLTAATGLEVGLLHPLAQHTLVRHLRGAQRYLFGSDTLLERALQRHGVDLLSHAHSLPPRFEVPTIGWIPDFQHKWLPNMFSAREVNVRDREFGGLCGRAVSVIVSSNVARADLERFYPSCPARVYTLRFVAGLATRAPATNSVELRRKYGLKCCFFYLPNQFWAHKNHAIVIEALRILKARRVAVEIVCSGSTHDYRQPKHFDMLRQRALAYGVGEALKILGVIPYQDVSALMRDAVAVINPSLFEGWSTTIEEAKSLGKAVIASDIPVHREQDPERASYFAPDDAEALAEVLSGSLARWDEAEERVRSAKALAELPERLRHFAREYEAIALGTVDDLASVR